MRMLLFVFLLFSTLSFSLFAQQQQFLEKENALLREAHELMLRGQYGQARNVISDLRKKTDHSSSIAADMAYYDVVCAIQLEAKDASAMTEFFSNEYRSSHWNDRIVFLNGRLQFSQKKYSEALETFEKVKISVLPPSEQDELAYLKGYCFLKQNKTSEALEQFEKAYSRPGPFQNASYYYAGHLYYTALEDEKALEVFDKIRHLPQYKKIVANYDLQIAYRKSDYVMVAEKGQEMLKQADIKKRAELLPVVADALFKIGDSKKSLELYQQLEKQSRAQLTRTDLYQLGILRYQSGLYKEAATSLQKINGGKDTLDQNAAYWLGQCYLQTEQTVFARTAFLSAYKNDQVDSITTDALLNYARLSIKIGSDPYLDAATELERFISGNKLHQRAGEAQQLLVQLFLTTKNYDAALASLEKKKNDDPELASIYQQLIYSLANESFSQGEYQKALDYFSRIPAHSTDKTAAEALFWMAESYCRLKNYVDASLMFKKFLAHRAASKTELLSLASYNLAYSYFQLKQYPQALSSFRQYLSNPVKGQAKLMADAQCRVGDCYFIARDYAKAIEAYKPVIGSKNAEVDYALFQSGMAFGALGKYNDKISRLDQLVKQHSRSAYYDEALYEMGITNLITNDQRSALAQFDKLTRERPRSPFAREALLKTGLIYFNNDQPEQAITALKKVAESFPGTPDAREALNTLKVIYMESNNLEAYFQLTNKLGFGQMNTNQQDSLAFVVAENFYLENKFPDAKAALTTYIKNNPEGQSLITANYYLAKINHRENPESAIPHWEFLVSRENHPYMQEAYKELARNFFDKEKYPEAASAYERVMALSESVMEKNEAVEGLMKSYYFQGKIQDAFVQAETLLNDPNAEPSQQRQANYIAGKALFETNKLKEAKTHLLQVHRSGNDVFGAESFYLISRISYQSNYMEDAEKQIFELSEKYRRFDYWVAKGFLLLADIYVKSNNIFQAKETLKSIVENYKGQDLRDEAARKLAQLP